MGTFGTVLALVLPGIAHQPAPGYLGSFIAGSSWIAVVATLNVSAQLALPDWVRGRGLAVFVSVLFGAMTLGSLAWGEIAGSFGLPAAHFSTAVVAILAIPLTKPWRPENAVGNELTPSMHWPAPVTAEAIEYGKGPVLVTIEYQVSRTPGGGCDGA